MSINNYHKASPGDILVVDDTPANLQLLVEILAADGHHIRPMPNAKEALNAIAQQTPDLILLDIMMPQMDGFELCQLLQRHPQTATIPVIFISAMTNPQDKARAFEVGGVDYIPKPFHRLEVLARVRHHLSYQRTQDALRTSEAEMRAIFAAMTDLVVIRDRQGRCLKVAPTQATQSLTSEQSLLQTPLAELVAPPDANRLQAAIQDTLSSCQTQKVQYQRLSDHSVKTWFDARLSPLTEDTVVWVARDITENKLTEQKLQRNEQEMRRIFEAMSDLVLVITPDHQDLQLMPTRYVQLEPVASAVIEQTFEKFFGAQGQLPFLNIIEQVLETQKIKSFEYHIRVEGQVFWFSASISPLSSTTVIWVARDISDRIQSEQELQHLAAELEQRVIQRTAQLQDMNTSLLSEINERRLAQARLEQSELRFRMAVDNLPDLFVIYDRHLCYQFVNQQAVQMLGREPDEMLGHPDLELFSTAITQDYLPLLEKTAQTQQIQSQECHVSVPGQGLMTLVITYVPLLNDQGELGQILGIAHDITERKRSERALNHAKEQLQAVIDAVPGFVSWIGAISDEASQASSQFYYLGANQRLAEAYHLTPSEFVGQPLGFLQLGQAFETLMQRLFMQPQTTLSDVITITQHGQERSYLIAAQKYQQNTAAVSVGIDISDRVQMEKRLQQSYERSQLLSELTLKVRQSLELEEIVDTTVRELHNLLHADRVALIKCYDENQGLVVQEVALPEFPPLRSTFFPASCATFEGADFIAIDDTNTLTASSTSQDKAFFQQFQIRAQLIVPIFVQQTLWGGVMVHQCTASRHWEPEEIDLLLALADQIGIALTQAQLLNHLEERVTERTLELQLEVIERTKAEAALRTSEEQLQRVIHNSTYGIVICNTQGIIEFVNPAAVQLFGRSQDELLGFELGIPIPSTEQAELSLLPAEDGSSCIVEMRVVEIYWERAAAYLISMMDITERKMVEQMKDEFLSIASHELRTPLTSIRGALGLLATGKLGAFTEQGQNMIDIAVSNTERLTRLLNDILDLERIESGRVKVIKQYCSGVELIVEAAQAMVGLAEENRITLSLEANHQVLSHDVQVYVPLPNTLPSSISTWADPDQILQTLTNLLSNAIKFSTAGQSVWIGVEQMPDCVQFYVRDRGRGIPTDKLELVFGRFQQVDASDSREKGGTGLGLAICHEIIRHHDGKIWVDSVLGRGSTFFFLLPNPKDKR